VPQRRVGDALHGPAVERGDRHRYQKHDQQDQRTTVRPIETRIRNLISAMKAADHENVAWAKLIMPDNAIDHGVADGDRP